jgi:hypothetical protein
MLSPIHALRRPRKIGTTGFEVPSEPARVFLPPQSSVSTLTQLSTTPTSSSSTTDDIAHSSSQPSQPSLPPSLPPPLPPPPPPSSSSSSSLPPPPPSSFPLSPLPSRPSPPHPLSYAAVVDAPPALIPTQLADLDASNVRETVPIPAELSRTFWIPEAPRTPWFVQNQAHGRRLPPPLDNLYVVVFSIPFVYVYISPSPPSLSFAYSFSVFSIYLSLHLSFSCSHA